MQSPSCTVVTTNIQGLWFSSAPRQCPFCGTLALVLVEAVGSWGRVISAACRGDTGSTLGWKGYVASMLKRCSPFLSSLIEGSGSTFAVTCIQSCSFWFYFSHIAKRDWSYSSWFLLTWKCTLNKESVVAWLQKGETCKPRSSLENGIACCKWGGIKWKGQTPAVASKTTLGIHFSLVIWHPHKGTRKDKVEQYMVLEASLTLQVTFFWKIQCPSKNVPYAWLSPRSSSSLILAREGSCSPLGSGLWRFPFLLSVGFYFHFLFLFFSVI